MSIVAPIRLKVEQDGTVKGYVETLNFVGGATVAVNGPVASITAGSGGGGGDAQTLDGHPASYFATEADLTTVEALIASMQDRATMWSTLGVAVQSTAPASGITYAQWLAGATGYWGWIELP